VSTLNARHDDSAASSRDTLRFGVFPLGLAGTPDGLAFGPPDDPDQIAAALGLLAGRTRPWLVRMYIPWHGASSSPRWLAELARLAGQPADFDIALCYRDGSGDVARWLEFVAEVMTRWGHRFSSLQITSEANLAGFPGASDGDYPRVAEALVHGVFKAASIKRDQRATAEVGFAVAFEPRPEASFLWPQVRQLGGSDFPSAVDYAGIDMYPDVFGPRMTLTRLGEAIGLIFKVFRERTLQSIGIGSDVPLHICENGWPTGSQRSEERQADALEAIIRRVHALRQEFNVTDWELFTLRDADSSKDDIFYQFGILKDDYTPKPAFDRLARLYGELSQPPE
jgi:hypothetical protein